MIDLDELERKMHEAFRAHTDMDDWRDAVLELNAALRINCPELIAMARRLEWIVDKAIDWDEVEHKAFLIELPVLRGPDVYSAIDAAMQEKP